MNARVLRSLTCVGLVLASACGGEIKRPGYPPRHVLLVSVAGLRADHTSFHLYPRPTTWLAYDGGQRALGKALSLDDLAREGVNFARAFSPSGDTRSSVATLLTGRSPLEHGVLCNGAPLPDDVPTLAEAFADAGFETVAFVAHVTGDGEHGLEGGFERGFSRWVTGETDVEVLGQAVTWVTKRDWGTGQSTFAWVHLRGPTFPFEPGTFPGVDGPVDYAKMFGDPDYAGDADGSDAFLEAAEALDPKDADRIVSLYDGEVALVSRTLAYFLDYYLYVGQQSSLWRETVFAFVGVHGVELPGIDGSMDEGLRWGSTDSLREGPLAIPLVLRHPDSLTGSRVFAEPVELADLAPTLLDWFGLAPPAEASGRSLLALTDTYVPRLFAAGPAVAWEEDGSWSLRTERWRLRVRAGPEAGAVTDLFYIARDPTQRENLAEQRPEVVAELLNTLDRWLETHPVHPTLANRGWVPAHSAK
jgi:arylsulfatase A-like enzyme